MTCSEVTRHHISCVMHGGDVQGMYELREYQLKPGHGVVPTFVDALARGCAPSSCTRRTASHSLCAHRWRLALIPSTLDSYLLRRLTRVPCAACCSIARSVAGCQTRWLPTTLDCLYSLASQRLACSTQCSSSGATQARKLA